MIKIFIDIYKFNHLPVIYKLKGCNYERKIYCKTKKQHKKKDDSIILTIRLNQKLQKEFDKLAFKSNHSRNELMCMALRYALDNLEFIPNK